MKHRTLGILGAVLLLGGVALGVAAGVLAGSSNGAHRDQAEPVVGRQGPQDVGPQPAQIGQQDPFPFRPGGPNGPGDPPPGQ